MVLEMVTTTVKHATLDVLLLGDCRKVYETFNSTGKCRETDTGDLKSPLIP